MSCDSLTLEDATCPVCRCILVSPVTAPCGHSLCGPCFEKSIDLSGLTCVLCRRRLSVWLRSARKSRSLLNTELWRKLQLTFPDHVQRRLSGLSDAAASPTLSPPAVWRCLSQPGEIGREYQDQVNKIQQQDITRRHRETRASERYIATLLPDDATTDTTDPHSVAKSCDHGEEGVGTQSTAGVKRRNSEVSADHDARDCKRPRLNPPLDQTDEVCGVELAQLDSVVRQQMEIERQLEQQKQDSILARRLHQQLNNRQVDRSVGSGQEYCLRSRHESSRRTD